MAETLESIRAQSLTDFRVLISVDRSDDQSFAVCQSYAETDSRFLVFTQPERLGWIGNVNWLLSRLKTPYATIVPHDDLLLPTFLEMLHSKLATTPSASLAYCDIEIFGYGDEVTRGIQPETSGSQFERVLRFLTDNVRAIGWRGMFRPDALGSEHLLDEANAAAADQVWLLKLAILGDCIRVPEVLYRKRLHSNSVVARTLTEGTFERGWIDHCVACHEIALAAAPWSKTEKRAIALACFRRALEPGRTSPADMSRVASDYKRCLAARLAYLPDPPSPPELPGYLDRLFRRDLQMLLRKH